MEAEWEAWRGHGPGMPPEMMGEWEAWEACRAWGQEAACREWDREAACPAEAVATFEFAFGGTQTLSGEYVPIEVFESSISSFVPIRRNWEQDPSPSKHARRHAGRRAPATAPAGTVAPGTLSLRAPGATIPARPSRPQPQWCTGRSGAPGAAPGPAARTSAGGAAPGSAVPALELRSRQPAFHRPRSSSDARRRPGRHQPRRRVTAPVLPATPQAATP